MPHKVYAKSAETPSRRTIRTPSRRDDSRGHIREPQSLFSKELTLERSRFRSWPRQTALNLLELPNHATLPVFHSGATGRFSKIHKQKPISPESFLLSPKVFREAADFLPDLSMLIMDIRENFTFRQCCDRRSTTRTLTLRVAQPTLTSTAQSSLHYVKESCAKDARRHGLVCQLALRSQLEANFFPLALRATLGRVTQIQTL